MKKILVLVMVLVASSVYTFANDSENYSAFYKLNNKTVYTALFGYIDAGQDQADYLQHVFKVTEKEMKAAVLKGNDTAVENVLNYNLKNTKSILSEEQYRKYLVFVNVYLNNEKNFALLTENKQIENVKKQQGKRINYYQPGKKQQIRFSS